MRSPHLAAAALALGAAVALGCRPQQPSQSSQAIQVLVSKPIVREVTDFEVFTGHLEAKQNVTIRARVSGYLEKVFFKEGRDVKEGDPLFLIDKRTYLADRDRAGAALVQAQAHLNRLKLDYARAESLLKTNAIAQQDFDQVAGDRAEADAAVKVADAALHSAQQYLDFTQINAPFSGRIGRQLIDPGNLVKADDTPLTTIVSLDPMYAYFDSDERSVLRTRRLIASGKIKSVRDAPIEAGVAVSDEEGFPHVGMINFVDNQVDQPTGTLRIRCTLSNPNGFFAPGMFVRVRVPIGSPHDAVLVSERALGSDQGEKFVYVVNGEGEVAYKAVKIGGLSGGLRIIESGLDKGQNVVISGLQRVKPGITVTAKAIKMTDLDSLPREDAPRAGLAGAAEKPSPGAAPIGGSPGVIAAAGSPGAGEPHKPEQSKGAKE